MSLTICKLDELTCVYIDAVFRYGSYIGNEYGPGEGSQCMNSAVCESNQTTSFLACRFTIGTHDDPSLDVSISCYDGMISDSFSHQGAPLL